jgi:membrane protein required for beta-lactamase induction
MWTGAVVGAAIVTMTFIFLVWMLFEIGFGWISILLLVLVAWMLFSAVKNRRRYAGFDIRR